jgi:hypothetical protein
MAKAKAWRAAWLTEPENVARLEAYKTAYRAKPENKARKRLLTNASRATPEGNAQRRAYEAALYAKPEIKARHKTRVAAYEAKPEIKARRKAQHAANRARATPETRAQWVAYNTGTRIEIPNHAPPDLCECCEQKSTRTLHLDHCHDTGRFRGWCCDGCNGGHGIKDNPELLRKRLAYMERPFQPGPIRWAYPKRELQVAA